MGVSGTGKSSIGQRLADLLDAQFLEGDEHHPEANIAKMSAGVPLTDDDRWPWLESLARLIRSWDTSGVSTVLTCSALRRSYRDVLRSAVPRPVVFIHLQADLEVLEMRMRERPGHFMPTSLLHSQLDTLEPLEPDETGFVIDVSVSLDDVLAAAVAAIKP